MPTFLTSHLSAGILIKVFAVYELLLAVWLVAGKYTKYAALLCAATLIGIVASGPNQLFTTFRDVGLAAMAAALYFLEK